MNLLVKMVFGSHLYGTNTEESDMDYKGIFMPTKEEIILGRVPKSISETTKKGNEEKNTAEDIDTDIYSLHYFIELACKGETVALDMLHAPPNKILHFTPIWNELVSHKEKFYTKNLKAFVGYCRKQAAKYGVKGSRLAVAKEVIEFLKDSRVQKVSELWRWLPQNEHAYFVEDSPNELRQYQVCGKIFQETITPEYMIGILETFVERYGKRAKLAEQNKGIDWKAVSHALRAAYQTKSILVNNTIIFPLPEAQFLLEVKQGNLNYIKEVSPVLESLMDEIEILSSESKLPKKVNRKFWDNFIIRKVGEYYGF